jgi:GNAT superfamily N-acetyltransferase
MQRAAMLPVARPEGMSVAEAVRSGEAQFALPQSLFDLLSGSVSAVDAPAAAALGLIPAQDMPAEALGTAGMAMGAGGLLSRPAGSVGMGGRVASDFNVQKSVRGMIGDQMDLTMNLVGPEGQRLGRVDYSVYDGQPAIQMIEVAPEFRRQGVATELLRNLQLEYPDQEIDWGSLTADGSQLYNSTRFIDVDQTGGASQFLPNLEARVRAAEADYLATFRNDFQGNPSPIREAFYRVEDELEAARGAAGLPPKRLIDTSDNRSTIAGLLASAAETPAQRVAGLLREGRASEVTDDLMAQADPQEMYRLYVAGETGADMPMDEASRMARAREMGADVGSFLYRGDARPDLQQFNTGQFAREGIGVTTSTSPNVAATYMSGDSPAMYQLVSMAKNPLLLDASGRNWTGIPADAVTNRGVLSDVLPPQRYLDEENLADFLNENVVDWGDGSSASMAMANTNDVSRAAQAAGFDEIRFQNVVDRGGAGRFHTGPANNPQTTVMTSDPRNIRSRFARFDPRLSHLANLNAANVDPITGLLAMVQAQEQQQ